MYSGSHLLRNRNFVVESKQLMMSSRSSMKGDFARYSLGSQLKQSESWSELCLTAQKDPRMNGDKYGTLEMTWQYVDMRANGER